MALTPVAPVLSNASADSSAPSNDGQGASTSRVAGGLNLPYLDALRGWAILLVILVHAGVVVGTLRAAGLEPFVWSEFGRRGVQLFYMISAFTLMLSLDFAPAQHAPLRNFYLRRVFRIGPLFYVAILLNLVWIAWSHSPRLPWLDVALGFLFLHGLSPRAINTVAIGGWSVGVEVLFYLILPFLAPRLQTLRRALAAAALSGLLLWPLSTRLERHTHNRSLGDYYLTTWLPSQLPVFLVGIALYIGWRDRLQPWALRSTEQQRRRASLALLLLAPWPLLLPRVPQMYTAAMAFSPILLAASIWPWRALINRFTVLLGRLSYSVYLLHFFVVIFVTWLWKESGIHAPGVTAHFVSQFPRTAILTTFALVTLLTIPVAMLSVRVIEKPGIALGRRLVRRLESRAT